MASVHISQNAACFDNVHVVKLPPLACGDSGGEIEISEILSIPSDATDEFGEPEILPRIGGEFQAELPQFDCMPHTKRHTNADYTAHPPENFVVGMPMLLTWVSNLNLDIPVSCGSSTSSDSTQIITKNEISSSKIEPLHDAVKPTEVCQNLRGLAHLVVPGIDDENWSAIEKDSFLLGLYIFEKNFVEVQRFVGTKKMGSLLSFYYGKFYRSQEYQRWSQCRKMKSKRCIYGQRIFTGLRQQELLSRILPKVSEECRNVLLEVSKTFVEEKMSLSDYVSSLKAMVGMPTLVEAIGIGTGKQDLTGMALESSKSNQANPVRPEIPTGKACSSLSTTEIVKFLSGNYRLSKAKSNDLFWEAVWPRLLARGWHSEQPRSKQCLVFLIPGVKKFSRSKLVKGDHYFDSITDILSKVAQEPGLIELDSEGDDGNKKSDEDENDHLPTKQRTCYLQPKTPNRNVAVPKFTVVDTSLSDGKVRELRTFPSEFSDAYVARDCTEDSDKETSEDASDVSDTITDNLSLKAVKSDEKLPCKSDHDLKYKKALKVSNQSRKATKSHSSRSRKQGNTDREAVSIPVPKQQLVFSPCRQKQMSTALESGMPPSCCTSANEFNENLSSQVGSCPDKLSSTSSSRGSPDESIENPQSQMLIDLNLPHISTDIADQPKDSVKLDDPGSRKSLANEVRSEHPPPPNLNPLRHSTRNRPPTSRVLEALADGYLTINRKRKGKDINSQDAVSRPQRVRVRSHESTNSSVESQVEEVENVASNSSNCNTFVRSGAAASQANEEPVSAQCGLSN